MMLLLTSDRRQAVFKVRLKLDAWSSCISRYYVSENSALQSKTDYVSVYERPDLLKRLFNIIPTWKMRAQYTTTETSLLYCVAFGLSYGWFRGANNMHSNNTAKAFGGDRSIVLIYEEEIERNAQGQ